MFRQTYACITSFAQDGDFVSVRLRRGLKNAFALIDDFVESDKNIAQIEDDDVYDVELPTLSEFKKTMNKSRKYQVVGYHYRIAIAKAHYF